MEPLDAQLQQVREELKMLLDQVNKTNGCE